MFRHPYVCVRWLPAATLALWGVAASAAIEYPGPMCGDANARIVNGKLSLWNYVLGISWEVKDGRLLPLGIADMRSGITTPKGGELFSLVLADGKTIRASDLALAKRREAGPIDLSDVKATTRSPGKKVAATFVSRDGMLHVQWQAVLRLDANYIQQELMIEPQGKDLPLAAIVPLDLPLVGARQAGEVRGSPVIAGNLFLACESPLASNEITPTEVRCRLPHKMLVKAGESCRCRSVVGVAPPGQCVERSSATSNAIAPGLISPFCTTTPGTTSPGSIASSTRNNRWTRSSDSAANWSTAAASGSMRSFSTTVGTTTARSGAVTRDFPTASGRWRGRRQVRPLGYVALAVGWLRRVKAAAAPVRPGPGLRDQCQRILPGRAKILRPIPRGLPRYDEEVRCELLQIRRRRRRQHRSRETLRRAEP